MRVGYVLKVYPRLSQTFIVHELRAHERAGLVPTVFSLRSPKPEDAGVVSPPLAAEIVYLPGPEDALPAQLAAAARERGIEHLHAHFAKLATRTARAAARLLGVPYSFTAHARDIFEQSVDPGALAERIHEAAQVVTVSQFNVEYLAHAFGRKPALVYNGLPLASLPFVPPSANGSEAPLLLGVGRLIEKKGFHVLLDACARLAEDGVSFRSEIVGEGPDRLALAARIDALGLSPRVRLVGALPPAETLERMRHAQVLAVPSVVAADGDRDGLPSVLLEAMALGTPCVATDVTGIPEALEDGVTGLLVRQHDAGALAGACARLLTDAALRARLAAAARTRVERRFSSEVNTRRLRALWGAAPLKVLFRVYNRRGLGHWMRGMNVARELLAMEPGTEIAFFTRSAPPFAVEDARIRVVQSETPEAMDVLPDALAAFAPDVIVDDTMPPGRLTCGEARHVFIMRRCAAPRQEQVFASPAVAAMDAVIVPHTPDEFGFELPAALAPRTTFVGPIARRAEPTAMAALRSRLGLERAGFVLLSTAGGGGFADDLARFVDVARRVHTRLAARLVEFRHVLVLGPNAGIEVAPVDGAMTVLASEPEMASLIACADAVLSAGGYNSVSEIRLARRPAFFLPGRRPHDDQFERVEALARAGVAEVVDGGDHDRAAEQVANACLDAERLAAMRAAYAHDAFVPGNRAAAQAILACARR
jgi:glycosyltransferase involved in cell wall biosynthesis